MCPPTLIGRISNNLQVYCYTKDCVFNIRWKAIDIHDRRPISYNICQIEKLVRSFEGCIIYLYACILIIIRCRGNARQSDCTTTCRNYPFRPPR